MSLEQDGRVKIKCKRDGTFEGLRQRGEQQSNWLILTFPGQHEFTLECAACLVSPFVPGRDQVPS